MQRNNQIGVPRGSSSGSSTADCHHGPSRGERNSSETLSMDIQIASDEALARELQELENQLTDTSFSESPTTETGKDQDHKTQFRDLLIYAMKFLHSHCF